MADQLRFAGFRFVAVSQGIDSASEQADVLMTVHGLVDSLYLKELVLSCVSSCPHHHGRGSVQLADNTEQRASASGLWS